jgi:hypothetical protein
VLAAAPIRPRVPPALVFNGVTKKFDGDQTNGSILVNSDQSGLKKGQRTIDVWDPYTGMHSVKAGVVGQ